MHAKGLRFRPPRSALTPELSWVLARAFGTAVRKTPPLTNMAEVLAAARDLGLSSRIAARLGRRQLTLELGEATAVAFAADRAQTAARSMLLRETVRDVAAVAEKVGLPIALLKFAALDAGGFLLEGSRPAGDVDVLAPPKRAEELATALRANGYAGINTPGYEHHLPALRGAHGIVEIHRQVPGLRLGRTRASATLQQMAAAELLAVAEHLPGRCMLPTRQVLIAHGLVHGLAQHGFSPRAYPLATVLADLQDLGFCGADGPSLAASLGPWIRRAVPDAEVEAARGLVLALAGGREPQGSARVLLDHLLAGTFDPDYAARLKLRQFRYPLSDRPRILVALSGVWAALRFAGRRPTGSIGGQENAAWARLGYLFHTSVQALRRERERPTCSGEKRTR